MNSGAAGSAPSPGEISIWYSGSSLPIPNGPLSSSALSLVNGIAGCEPQVVEIDRLRHRDAHAVAVRRHLVDDAQVRERDAERHPLRERPPAALHRDLRARGPPARRARRRRASRAIRSRTTRP
jgi:hypothetical protein